MSRNDTYTLHRKRSDTEEGRKIGSGEDEVFEQYANMPRAQQQQCFVMLGGMTLSHLEMDNFVRRRRGDVATDDS